MLVFKVDGQWERLPRHCSRSAEAGGETALFEMLLRQQCWDRLLCLLLFVGLPVSRFVRWPVEFIEFVGFIGFVGFVESIGSVESF